MRIQVRYCHIVGRRAAVNSVILGAGHRGRNDFSNGMVSSTDTLSSDSALATRHHRIGHEGDVTRRRSAIQLNLEGEAGGCMTGEDRGDAREVRRQITVFVVDHSDIGQSHVCAIGDGDAITERRILSVALHADRRFAIGSADFRALGIRPHETGNFFGNVDARRALHEERAACRVGDAAGIASIAANRNDRVSLQATRTIGSGRYIIGRVRLRRSGGTAFGERRDGRNDLVQEGVKQGHVCQSDVAAIGYNAAEGNRATGLNN